MVTIKRHPVTNRLLYCGQGKLKKQNLRGANLWKADLRGANLKGANLEGADLRGANLEGADLEGADLQWANLRGANLEGADLWKANLEGANLRGANLQWANLRGANLEGADLDFSCLPLWCGGQGAKIDRNLASQYILHALAFVVDPDEVPEYEEIRKAAASLCSTNPHRCEIKWK